MRTTEITYDMLESLWRECGAMPYTSHGDGKDSTANVSLRLCEMVGAPPHKSAFSQPLLTGVFGTYYNFAHATPREESGDFLDHTADEILNTHIRSTDEKIKEANRQLGKYLDRLSN